MQPQCRSKGLRCCSQPCPLYRPTQGWLKTQSS